MTTAVLRPRPPMPDTDAAWIRAHVLAPKQIPPAWHECPCQGLSNACDHGRHTECGHDQWVAWWGREPETVIQTFGGSPCAGACGLGRGWATVHLADRSCWTRCTCRCHQPPPEHRTAPRAHRATRPVPGGHMSTRPTIHHLATRPDGTVPPTCNHLAEYARANGEPVPTVNLTHRVGQTIDHPSPGQKWYTDKPFSYFHMYTRPGEVLDRIEDGWPIRLWIVEPLGEVGNWGGVHYPYWRMSHQIRVVEETEAWRAFGHRGKQTLATVAQLPDLAKEWAAVWAADPERTRRTYAPWMKRVEDTHALDWWVFFRAQYSRREAARETAEKLALAAVEPIVADASEEAAAAIRLRARCLVAGQLLFDRIRNGEYEQEVRGYLLGTALDSAQPALA